MQHKKTLCLQDLFHTSASVDLVFEEHPVITDPANELPFDEIIAKAEQPEHVELDPLPHLEIPTTKHHSSH